MSQKKIDKLLTDNIEKEKKTTKKKPSPKKEKSSHMVEQQVEVDMDLEQEKYRQLLDFFKVYRDPVHGDIWVTELEQKIIDHRLFQRLRRVKQLGPTFLIYPGAMHTRFEHSLGTLHISQKIVESIQINAKMIPTCKEILPREIFIIRIIALIHDMAHTSWGHTIEDEGSVIKAQQWLNKERREIILKVINNILEAFLTRNKLIHGYKELCKIIEDTLIAEEVGEFDSVVEVGGREKSLKGIKSLGYPFIADVVGNTICADFLDYIYRDCYFSGLKMVYDPRIFSYFALREDENKKVRVCILLSREQKKFRWDILNYCVDLLRMRYDLAQKVYHHKVKRKFSAIIIKMAYCAIKCKLLSEDDLFEYGDDVIPQLIIMRENPKKNKEDNRYCKASVRLAKAFLERKIYDVIYETPYNPKSGGGAHLENYYNIPDNRYETENIIEQLFNLDPGSIIIYASKLNSGKKALVKMYRWTEENGHQILTLKDLSETPGFRTIYAQLTTLKELYEDMWIFYVLIDREVYKSIENPDRLINLTKNICNNSKEAILDESIDMILPKLCENPESKILAAEFLSIKQAAISKIKSRFIPSSESTKKRLDFIDFITLTLKGCINERENGI